MLRIARPLSQLSETVNTIARNKQNLDSKHPKIDVLRKNANKIEIEC